MKVTTGNVEAKKYSPFYLASMRLWLYADELYAALEHERDTFLSVSPVRPGQIIIHTSTLCGEDTVCLAYERSLS